MAKRYWVMRVDPDQQSLFWKELKEGRLRQGWGYKPEQDLREIKIKKGKGKEISDIQKETWRRNRRMLSTEEDGIQKGDIIISPKLPESGKWCISEVIGDYDYDMIPKSRFDASHNDNDSDYGHYLRVKLLPRPVNPNEEGVNAKLRQTMRCQQPLWNIDSYKDYVEQLINTVQNAKGAPKISSVETKIDTINKEISKNLLDQLLNQFHGAEFEEPCINLLKELFGEESVEPVGGPHENGADAICSYYDPLGTYHSIAVQIKMWEGHANIKEPLKQIKKAYESYPGITSGVILTTAKEINNLEEEKAKMESEIKIPIRVIYGTELMRMFLKYLSDQEIVNE